MEPKKYKLGRMKHGRRTKWSADVIHRDHGVIGTVHQGGYAPRWVYSLDQFRRPFIWCGRALNEDWCLLDGGPYDSADEAAAVAAERVERFLKANPSEV